MKKLFLIGKRKETDDFLIYPFSQQEKQIDVIVSFDGKDTLTNICSNNDVHARYKITKFLPSNLIISPFGNGQYKFIIDPDEENYIERILHDVTTMMHSYKGEHLNNIRIVELEVLKTV